MDTTHFSRAMVMLALVLVCGCNGAQKEAEAAFQKGLQAEKAADLPGARDAYALAASKDPTGATGQLAKDRLAKIQSCLAEKEAWHSAVGPNSPYPMGEKGACAGLPETDKEKAARVGLERASAEKQRAALDAAKKATEFSYHAPGGTLSGWGQHLLEKCDKLHMFPWACSAKDPAKSPNEECELLRQHYQCQVAQGWIYCCPFNHGAKPD